MSPYSQSPSAHSSWARDQWKTLSPCTRCSRPDSNREPRDYESPALTIELQELSALALQYAKLSHKGNRVLQRLLILPSFDMASTIYGSLSVEMPRLSAHPDAAPSISSVPIFTASRCALAWQSTPLLRRGAQGGAPCRDLFKSRLPACPGPLELGEPLPLGAQCHLR